MSQNERIKRCKSCGESNSFKSDFCEYCGHQMYYKEKYEKLTVKELEILQEKKLWNVFLFCIAGLQIFFSTYFMNYFFTYFQLNQLATVISLILLLLLFLSFGLIIKNTLDLIGILFYVRIKDSYKAKVKEIALRHFHAGRYKKKISNDVADELKERFYFVNEEIKKYQYKMKERMKPIFIISCLFLLLLSLSLPINYFYKDFLLSISIGFTLALFPVYLFGKIFKEISFNTPQDLGRNLNDADLEDFIYYLSALGFKNAGKRIWICVAFLLALVILIFFNMLINYDLPVS